MSLNRAVEELILTELENIRLREAICEQDENAMIRALWSCGDTSIVGYAMLRARLNRNERDALTLVLDECMTQEEAAEHLGVSTRSLQAWWRSELTKILKQPWARAYAAELARRR